MPVSGVQRFAAAAVAAAATTAAAAAHQLVVPQTLGNQGLQVFNAKPLQRLRCTHLSYHLEQQQVCSCMQGTSEASYRQGSPLDAPRATNCCHVDVH